MASEAEGFEEGLRRARDQARMEAGLRRARDAAARKNLRLSQAKALGRGVRQGITFGAGDEIAARIQAIGPSSYEDELEKVRSNLAESREKHPYLTTGGEIAAGAGMAFVPGIGWAGTAMRGAKAGQLAGTAGRAALSGGAQGALHGFNSGEGDVREQGSTRLGSASGGAILGAAGGAIMTPIAAAAGTAINKAIPTARLAANKLTGTKTHGIQGGGEITPYADDAARRAIQQKLMEAAEHRPGMEARLRAAQRDGQGDVYTMADAMGPSGAGALEGLAGNDTGIDHMARSAFQARKDAQGERVADIIRERIGLARDGAGRTHTMGSMHGAIDDFRRGVNKVNYEMAERAADDVNVDAALATINRHLKGREGTTLTDPVDKQLAAWRTRLEGVRGEDVPETGRHWRDRPTVIDADPSGPPPPQEVELTKFEMVNEVRKDIADAASDALSKDVHGNVKKPALGLRLKGIAADLDKSLEEASPFYRLAQNTHREQKKVGRAITQGMKDARPGRRLDDIKATYESLGTTKATGPLGDRTGLGATEATPGPFSAREGYRTGFMEPELARIEAGASTRDSARPLTSRKAREIYEMFEKDYASTPEGAEALAGRGGIAERLARERDMVQTDHQALQGSPTARRLGNIESMESKASTWARTLGQGGVSGVTGKALGNALEAVGVSSPAAKKEMARILMLKGDSAADAIREILASRFMYLSQARQNQLYNAATRAAGAAGGESASYSKHEGVR